MDTEKFAVALNRRTRGRILAIDEKRDTYVLYLRNSKRISIDFIGLDDDPDAVIAEVEFQLAAPPIIQ